MHILLIGSGARESAYVWNFEKHGHTVTCAPGNAGVQNYLPGIKPMEFERLANVAKSTGADLAVVGPEAPLCAGIWDYFNERGIPLCGPSKAAARTEASKVWTKYLLAEAGVPSAPFAVYSREDMASACCSGYIAERGVRNIVVKAEGLCGGKGVFLPDTIEEVAPKCDALYAEYGAAAERFVVEDRLSGPERSLIAMTDGRSLMYFTPVQDHKRRLNGDKGDNTGGMGAYTCALKDEERCRIYVADTIRSLKRRGIEYRGPIYFGFIMTEDGPQTLEINCRGGDPEMQAILASTDFDFGAYCYAMAIGNFGGLRPPEKSCEAVTINLVDPSYPGKPSLPPITRIRGIDKAKALGALVFHGATGRGPEGPTTNGAGRVLSVVGRGGTLAEARALAYTAVSEIRFGDSRPGFRTDIAG